jgi:hypothetical protein
MDEGTHSGAKGTIGYSTAAVPQTGPVDATFDLLTLIAD